jgi:hypothetical protein
MNVLISFQVYDLESNDIPAVLRQTGLKLFVVFKASFPQVVRRVPEILLLGSRRKLKLVSDLEGSLMRASARFEVIVPSKKQLSPFTGGIS